MSGTRVILSCHCFICLFSPYPGFPFHCSPNPEKERAAERERQQHELAAVRASLATAQQDVAAYRARVETLERQWATLGDLPAILRAKGQPTKNKRPGPAKKAAKSARPRARSPR